MTASLQNKDMPALKKASVGDITAGDKETFVAAENGVSKRPEEKQPLTEVGKETEMRHMDKLIDPTENHQPQASCINVSLSYVIDPKAPCW